MNGYWTTKNPYKLCAIVMAWSKDMKERIKTVKKINYQNKIRIISKMGEQKTLYMITDKLKTDGYRQTGN